MRVVADLDDGRQLPGQRSHDYNFGALEPARITRTNVPQRPPHEPALVERLGHVVLQRTCNLENVNWYLENGDLDRFEQLRLMLRVNGDVRQDSTVRDMIHRPTEALRTLTGFQRVDPGDLILTGTPGGTALKAPPKPIEIIGALLPPAVKWKIFFKRQASNPAYLQDGDVVELTIATDDAMLDPGMQRTTVRSA